VGAHSSWRPIQDRRFQEATEKRVENCQGLVEQGKLSESEKIVSGRHSEEIAVKNRFHCFVHEDGPRIGIELDTVPLYTFQKQLFPPTPSDSDTVKQTLEPLRKTSHTKYLAGQKRLA
jgi:hypothetical protein